MEMLNQKQKFIVIILIIIAIGIMVFYYINSTHEVYSYNEIENIVQDNDEVYEKNENMKNIIVHITGAVKNNGVVEVKKNARINDVIEAAGGMTNDANLDDVNLAYIVEDGQKIYIPSNEDKKEIQKEDIIEVVSEGPGDNIIDDYKETNTNLININKASLEELKTLPGIGEATALKILMYREENKQFNSIEELKEVSGVGNAKFDTIKDLICI